MNAKKINLLLLVALFVATIFLSFYGINAGVMASPTLVTPNSNEYKFPLNATALAPLHGGTNPSYRFVVYHGDGTFFMGTEAELAAHTHVYSSASPSYNPFMEIIARYNDGSLPPERTAFTTVTTSVSNGGSVVQPDVPMGTKKILLQSTCSAVPGDSITYIATLDLHGLGTNPVSGSVILRYNKLVFGSHGANPYYPSNGIFNAMPSPIQDPNDQGLYMVTYSFTNLPPDKQYTLFFLLETFDNQALLGLDPRPSVQLNISSNSPEKPSFTDQITGTTVLNAHDPNYKEVISNDVCNPDGNITWRIHFQNEGSAPEDSIWITDWIDTMLNYNSVALSSQMTGLFSQWKRHDERTINCLLKGIHLRGLGERGVPEDETRGYIDITATKRQSEACNAFVNRARIRFGNKPPIETADVIVPMPCNLCTDTCATILDTTFAWRPTVIGDTLFNDLMSSSGIFNMLQNANFIKWYPTDGLSNPFILNPVVTKNVRRVFTLVASFSGCQKVVLRMPVGPNCTLGIHETKALANADCSNPTWNLTALETGASATNLMWSNSQTGVDRISRSGLSTGLFYVGVWDTLTGCSAEKWFKLPDKCNSTNKGFPWTPIGVAAFMFVIAFLLFKIFTKR